MLSTPAYRSVLTEEALGVLAQTRRFFVQAISAYKPARIRTTTIGPIDAHSIARQAALLRYVSTTEAFVNAALFDELATALGTPDPIVRVLLEDLEENATRDWNRRAAAFFKWHGVGIKSCTGWQQVDAATAARNCIAHGLGRLGVRQRSQAFADRVARLGIQVIGGGLAIDDGAVDATYEACAAFMKAIDAEL